MWKGKFQCVCNQHPSSSNFHSMNSPLILHCWLTLVPENSHREILFSLTLWEQRKEIKEWNALRILSCDCSALLYVIFATVINLNTVWSSKQSVSWLVLASCQLCTMTNNIKSKLITILLAPSATSFLFILLLCYVCLRQ